MLTTFSESPLLTAHPFVEPPPTVHSRAFPTLPVSVPMEGEKQQFACPSARLSGTNSPGLRLSVRPREHARTSSRPETPGRGPGATGPGSLPLPGRSASPRHRPGRPVGRMRAALPGVPATLPPPTPRACHFLPSPHLRPGSVSRSLSLRESLCFPLPTRSAAVAQALRGGGDRERERLT